MFSHFPKCRDCDVCLRTKITKAPCRRRTGEALPQAEKFGDSKTADHKVLNEGCESRKITDTLSSFKILPFNGNSPIRAKTRPHRPEKC